jgi:ABC-type transport system substrate-binding protein
MKRILFLGLLIVLVLALLLPGCGSPKETATITSTSTVTSTTTATETATATTTATTATGPYGDLVMAVDNIGNEVWAPDVGSSYDTVMIAPAFDLLVTVTGSDEPLEYQPQLAKTWQISEDGLTWDFYLEEGVQFHDGWGEFTAEDVKYTFELISAPGSTRDIPLQVGEDQNVSSFEVVDTYHFRINMNNPLPLMLFYLSDCQCNIHCKKYYETVGHDVAMKNPIGTGPWQFIGYQPANYIEFEAVENHWRQTPAYKTLTLKAVPELSARLAMLQTGEANLCIIPPDRKGEMEAAGLKMVLVPGTSGYDVALGGSCLATRETYDPTCPWVYNSEEPWDSAFNQRAYLVRKALAYAVNKDAIISTILNNLADPSPLRDWPLNSSWSRSTWEPYPYDPEEAQTLLEEAGYPDGFSKTITFYAISGAGSALHPLVSQAVAMDWQAIGLDVEIVPADWPVVRAKTVARDTAWCAYVTGWVVFLEPWLDISFSGNSKGNFVEGLEHPELDALIDAVESTSDVEARRQIALELGDWQYEHIYEIGIATGYTVIATASEIGAWTIRHAPPLLPYDFEFITHAD